MRVKTSITSTLMAALTLFFCSNALAETGFVLPHNPQDAPNPAQIYEELYDLEAQEHHGRKDILAAALKVKNSKGDARKLAQIQYIESRAEHVLNVSRRIMTIVSAQDKLTEERKREYEYWRTFYESDEGEGLRTLVTIVLHSQSKFVQKEMNVVERVSLTQQKTQTLLLTVLASPFEQDQQEAKRVKQLRAELIQLLRDMRSDLSGLKASLDRITIAR